MKAQHVSTSTLLLVGALVSNNLHAQSTLEQIGNAISEGSVDVSFRYRSESVDQDNSLRDSHASTLRTRLSLSTANVNGLSALLELDNVSTVGPDHYDSLVMDKYRGTYSVIADPVGSEVNQALIRYRPDDNQTFTIGTQRILHADQRFIGGVGWRQNEQTFDSVRWQRSTASYDIDYSYIWNVNRIFGGSKRSIQRSNLTSDSHAALVTYKTGVGNFRGYVYALDFEDAAALSSLTWGLSYNGQFDRVGINASIATQSDYGDNPNSYRAPYVAADVSYNAGPARFLLGYEVLGSDDSTAAFATPLATLHKWQGWADLFLSTPVAGIEDSYATVSGKLGNATLSATYHRLESDEGSIHYGNEWDLVASYPLLSNLTAQLKYSTYDAENHAVDTDKLWLTLNLTF